MKTYDVPARRWEHGWELHIADVGVTQSHSLWDAELMARDLISRHTGTEPGSFAVSITPEFGGRPRRAHPRGQGSRQRRR